MAVPGNLRPGRKSRRSAGNGRRKNRPRPERSAARRSRPRGAAGRCSKKGEAAPGCSLPVVSPAGSRMNGLDPIKVRSDAMTDHWLAVSLIAFGGLADVLSSAAWAQSYPGKPVRVVVASSAGSNPDTVGRIVANGLAQVFGQQVIVDNRAGAGGNIGAELAARAPAGGYTLFLPPPNHS